MAYLDNHKFANLFIKITPDYHSQSYDLFIDSVKAFPYFSSCFAYCCHTTLPFLFGKLKLILFVTWQQVRVAAIQKLASNIQRNIMWLDDSKANEYLGSLHDFTCFLSLALLLNNVSIKCDTCHMQHVRQSSSRKWNCLPPTLSYTISSINDPYSHTPPIHAVIILSRLKCLFF